LSQKKKKTLQLSGIERRGYLRIGRTFIRRFCRLSHIFRCDKTYGARRYISELNSDWHPIGAATSAVRDPCQDSAVQYCSAIDWPTIKKDVFESFGARIFFIKNLSLEALGDRYLIDFGTPKTQRIPEIGISEKPRR
jgi:hypothetical protein